MFKVAMPDPKFDQTRGIIRLRAADAGWIISDAEVEKMLEVGGVLNAFLADVFATVFIGQSKDATRLLCSFMVSYVQMMAISLREKNDPAAADAIYLALAGAVAELRQPN